MFHVSWHPKNLQLPNNSGLSFPVSVSTRHRRCAHTTLHRVYCHKVSFFHRVHAKGGSLYTCLRLRDFLGTPCLPRPIRPSALPLKFATEGICAHGGRLNRSTGLTCGQSYIRAPGVVHMVACSIRQSIVRIHSRMKVLHLSSA